MKLKELKKVYKYDEVNDIFDIDIQLEDYRDAYSDWDFSPFVNRDLDEDLTEYLLECSYEISLKTDLNINFHILNHEKNDVREKKSITGMYNYFEYKIRKLRNYRMRVIRDIITSLIIGSVLLVMGTYLDDLYSESFWLDIISEGFYIGGWVMIWEMFSAWFFDIKKVTHKMKHFIRLEGTEIKYKYDQGG